MNMELSTYNRNCCFGLNPIKSTLYENISNFKTQIMHTNILSKININETVLENAMSEKY